jgi:hypothetical protein
MSRLAQVIAGLAIVPLVAGISHARPTPAAKCAAEKNKAADNKIGAKLTCYRKALLAGTAVDSTCLANAETKFGTAIMKAEAVGGCVVTGDAAAIENACDDAVAAIVALTPGTTTTTTTLPPSCSTFAASCGSCAGGGTCVPRTAEYIADNSCVGGPGPCTCCACASPDCDNSRTCTSDADCAPGKACIVVPLPTGGAGLCCTPCP